MCLPPCHLAGCLGRCAAMLCLLYQAPMLTVPCCVLRHAAVSVTPPRTATQTAQQMSASSTSGGVRQGTIDCNVAHQCPPCSRHRMCPARAVCCCSWSGCPVRTRAQQRLTAWCFAHAAQLQVLPYLQMLMPPPLSPCPSLLRPCPLQCGPGAVRWVGRVPLLLE